MRIRHEADSGPECRLRAALLRWRAPGAGPILAGAAWQEPNGMVYWGWPDDGGKVAMRLGVGRPEGCCILPPALSLALSIRRSDAELGARALVIGEGFLARIARAVVDGVGFRVMGSAGRSEVECGAGARPNIVIETTGEPCNLDWAVSHCADWGSVFSMGGALTSVSLDHYPHVHRRALKLIHVPERPVLLPGEEAISERGAARLAEILEGIAPARDEALDAHVLPEGVVGRLARERSGWGLLLLGER